MNIQYFDEPWRHVVIDNALPEDLFNKFLEVNDDIQSVCQICEDPSSKTQVKYAYRKGESNIDASEDDYYFKNYKLLDLIKIQFDDLLFDLVEDANKYITDNFTKLYNKKFCNSDIFEPMEEDWFFKTGIQAQPPGFKYPNHDESKMKKMSIVIFLDPKENIGTWLYDSEEQDYDKPTKKIEWKQNRAFIFCGAEEKTWHSFQAAADIDDFRTTIVSFLYDPKQRWDPKPKRTKNNV